VKIGGEGSAITFEYVLGSGIVFAENGFGLTFWEAVFRTEWDWDWDWGCGWGWSWEWVGGLSTSSCNCCSD
jgi:hypothetical protein